MISWIKKRILYCLITSAFIYILWDIITVYVTPPAISYEMSIYDMYPWYFWFLLIASNLTGQLILIESIYFSQKTKHWIIGLIVILISNSILLFLPVIRNYTIYGRGDTLTHIGYMEDIIKSGHIGISNMYPMSHVLVVIVNFFSNIDLFLLIKIVLPIFYFFYVTSFFVLSKNLFQNWTEIVLSIIFSSILLFSFANVAFTPNALSYLLVPFIFYLYIRSNQSPPDIRFNFLLIVNLILMVFFHPLVSLLLTFIFLIMELSEYIGSTIPFIKNLIVDKSLKISLNKHVKLASIILITFSIWNVYLYILVRSMYRIVNQFMGEAAYSEFNNYKDIIDKNTPSPVDVINIILSSYGQWIILGVLAMLSILYLIWFTKTSKGHGEIRFHHLFSGIGFLFFSFLSLFALFLPYTISFMRIYLMGLFFALILIPSALSIFLNYHKTHMMIKLIFSCLILLFILYFTTFNLFYTPRITYDNQQVTDTELVGMENFFNIRSNNITILEIGISQNRLYDAIYGKEAPRKNIADLSRPVMRPIDHFGYENHSSLIFSYKEPMYILLTNLGKNFYPYTYPNYKDKWRYTSEDFTKLKLDTGVYLLYTNGNLEAYLSVPMEIR